MVRYVNNQRRDRAAGGRGMMESTNVGVDTPVPTGRRI